MSAHYRAFVAVLVLTVATILVLRWLLKGTYLYDILERRRNYWLAATAITFLVPNFVLAMTLLGAMYVWAARKDPHPVGIFLMFLLAVPPWTLELQGFGPFNQLFALTHFRTMSLAILLPLALKMALSDRKPAATLNVSAGRVTDVSVIVLSVYLLAVYVPELSATALMRRALLTGLDFLLPYFVITRYLRDRAAVMDGLGSLLLGGLIIAPIAAFEHFKGWLLYESTAGNWNIPMSLSMFLIRDERLRAMATGGHALTLGHYIVVSFAIMAIFAAQVRSNLKLVLLWGMLALALYATLSRGPLVATVVVLLLMGVFTGRTFRYYTALAGAAGAIVLALAFSPWWDKFVRVLPFVGTVELANVTYRQQLFDATVLLVSQRPWFGTIHVLQYLEHLRQGQGIIDLVNTYAIYALNFGLVGLFLFLLFLCSGIGLGLEAAFRSRRSDLDTFRIAGCTASALIGSMIVIVATSNMDSVPFVYTALVALLVAIARMVRPVRDPRALYRRGAQKAPSGQPRARWPGGATQA